MSELLGYEFMRHAVLAGVIAGMICGVIGTLVVVNRIVFLSGGIAHAAYGGIGLSYFMGWPYLLGTVGFSMLAAMVMAAVTLNAKHRADTVIGVIWAVGMALGVIFIDLTPGYTADLMSYLFGSILAVSKADIFYMGGLFLFICIVVWYFYEEFLAMSYDPEFARVRGVPVQMLYFLLIGMVALAVVMVIRVVGLILVIALLTIPPYIAEQYATSVGRMIIISTVLGLIFTLGGLSLSYAFNLTSGAVIILVAGSGFFACVLLKWIFQRFSHRGD
ncbi:MAG: metal ABC transporter permease [Desulfobacterales bacterium]